MKNFLAGFVAVCFMTLAVAVPAEAGDDGPQYYVAPDMKAQGFPFSTAVRHGQTLYLAGVIGTKPGKPEVVDGGIEAETRRAMELIGETLEAHGLGYTNLVKCTVFLADMAEWPTFNQVYRGYFGGGPFPARSAFGVNGLALNARMEIECLAAFPG